MKQIQVQVDLQIEINDSVCDVIGGVNTDDDVIAEVAAQVFQALTGELGPGSCRGYARIKGAIELRRAWSALKEDWLEV